MEARFALSGANFIRLKLMAGTTISDAGIPVLGADVATTDLASVEPTTQSTAVATGTQAGLCLDTSGTVAATGITDSDDLFVTVIVNPDLVLGAKASDGATSGTALTAQATTSASVGGTVATGVTTLDDGWIYGVSGANAGEFRRADDAAGSVSINFPNDIALGDEFIAVHGFPFGYGGFVSYDLTSDLTEVNATTAVTDKDNYSTLDIKVDLNSPTDTVEYLLVANNHYLGSSSIT